MTLLSFSLSHQTAPVGAREEAVSSLGDLRVWLTAIEKRMVSVEAFVVSTCHRLEIYIVTEDEEPARKLLAAACGVAPGAFDCDGTSGWRIRRNVDAAIHLARVTTGLDSLIVGEAEIAGQVRRAAALAREAGALGPRLENVLAGALRSSGRARSETRISEGVMSAASAGVALATSTLGSLAGRYVLVIGAGQAARTALGRLARRKVGRVSVASRSRRHAEEAAAVVGGDVWSLEAVPLRLHELDVILAATHGGHFVVTADSCRTAFLGQPGRRRVFVDLSVPRVIEPAAAALPDVSLWSVDDLGDLAAQSMRRREREIPLAEAVAKDEGQRAFARMRARRARP